MTGDRVWREISPEEVNMVNAIIMTSGIPEGRRRAAETTDDSANRTRRGGGRS